MCVCSLGVCVCFVERWLLVVKLKQTKEKTFNRIYVNIKKGQIESNADSGCSSEWARHKGDVSMKAGQEGQSSGS